jgi:glutathione S-transferase
LTPLLYSFRRCPYAMRARLALIASGQSVELREVSLRAKPAEMLAASPKATVPVLVTPEGVIDESLQIMLWALQRADPQGWLDMPSEGQAWITRADSEFKPALDGVKYASRHPAPEAATHLQSAQSFLTDLDAQFGHWLFDHPSLADFALLPFIRQFAAIDPAWFAAQAWPRLQVWLARFLASEAFATAMQKFPLWQPEDPPRLFP